MAMWAGLKGMVMRVGLQRGWGQCSKWAGLQEGAWLTGAGP